MEFDTGTIMIIIIAVVAVAICWPAISWLISLFLKRRDRMVEGPIDVHEMLLHKMKKASRRNLKGKRLKFVHLLGDDDSAPCQYGKIYGIIKSQDTVELFVWNGRKHLSKVKWLRVPIEITRDEFGKNYCIKCRGFRPKANYFVPIWPGEMCDDERHMFERILDKSLQFLITVEKSEEIHEQNINAMVESVNAKRPQPQVYERDDHLTNASPEAVRHAEDETA
jgi:hypothetical protein